MEFTDVKDIDNNELKDLINDGSQVKVSLLMAVQQEPDKREENRIHLKNMMKEAQAKMAQINLRTPESEQLLAPVEPLIQGGRFMELSQPGLAIYLAEGFSRFYFLPYAPENGATVGAQFNIKPLMPSRNTDYFYVLALSQDNVRLLHAQEHSVERISLERMPQSLDEALRWDDPEKQLQWHTQTGRLQGDGREAVFHGHGVAAKDTQKENLLRYFQLLDKGINNILGSERTPLILAGVDYLLPIYRQASSYNELLDQEITGNQEHLSDDQLSEKAWSIIEDHLQEQSDLIHTRYQELAARDLASSDLQQVITAAHHGRVNTLFVAMDEEQWGDFDPQTGKIIRTVQPQPGSVELLNLAAIYAIKNDGDIVAKNREELPNEAPISAMFRF